MICAKCNKNNLIKSGLINGIQRYKCKNCSAYFMETTKRVKEKDCLRAVRFCTRGIPANTVAKMFFVTSTTVKRWIEHYQKQKFQASFDHNADEFLAHRWRSFSKSERLNQILRFQIDRLQKLYKC